MFSIHVENLVCVGLIPSEISVLKKYKGKNLFRIRQFRNINHSVLWNISTDKQKSNHFFGVLLFKIPYSVPEISHFYLWGRKPPLSILNRTRPSSSLRWVLLSDFEVCVGHKWGPWSLNLLELAEKRYYLHDKSFYFYLTWDIGPIGW